MKNYKTLVRFFKIIMQNKKLIIFSIFIVMVLSSVIDLLLPQFTKNIIDKAIKLKNSNLLFKLIIGYLLFNLIQIFLDLILQYINAKLKKSMSVKLKIYLLNHLSKLSGHYYSNIKTGNLLSILERDLFVVESFGFDVIFTIIMDIFTALIAFGFLVHMQFDLLIIIIVLQIFLAYSQSKFSTKISTQTEEVRDNYGDISNLTQEYISNIMHVVISNSYFKFFKTYINKERKLLKKCLNLDLIIMSNFSISQVLGTLISASIYGIGGLKVINNKMTIGDLIIFQQYTSMFIGPCVRVIKSNTRIQQAVVSINRIFTILDEPITIKQDNTGKKVYKDLVQNIIFKDVCFSYENINVLNNINLNFEKGNVTSLVGTSGCGKSTIINLLFRLWEVDKGSIFINDVELKEYNLKSLRKNISIVTQDILLFDDTIFNNLTLNNKVNINFVEDICKKVDIYGFIDNLPNKFNTIVGEKGVKLSGGQKQRIAIARALINQANILIFDEATSALDNLSQSLILDNIKDLLKDKIVILIAHRLSTVVDSDKIYVINEGKVVEKGTHCELIKNKNIYYKLTNNSFEEIKLVEV